MLVEEIIENGGATFNPYTELVPTKGFMVSVAESEEIINLKEFTQDVLNTFVRSNVASLLREENFVGVWVENGFVYLDISRNISTLIRAMSMAKEESQLAIYNLDNQKVIKL